MKNQFISIRTQLITASLISLGSSVFAAPIISRCTNLNIAPVSRTPVEPGTKAYIWPDDKGNYTLEQFTMHMQTGDTLYLRAGTIVGNIDSYPADIKPITGSNRIHIRGQGVGRTTLQGTVSIGAGSTVQDLNITNSNPDKITMQVSPPSLTMKYARIEGGRMALLAVNTGLIPGKTTDKVKLDCVATLNSKYSGIVIGANSAPKINNVELTDVSVNNTGMIGIEVFGDNAKLLQVSTANTRVLGIDVNGDKAMIKDSLVRSSAGNGISIGGVNSTVDNVTLDEIGNADNGNAVMVRENATGYVIKNSRISKVRVGIFLDAGSSGSVSSNTYSNIFFMNVLDDSNESPFKPKPHN